METTNRCILGLVFGATSVVMSRLLLIPQRLSLPEVVENRLMFVPRLVNEEIELKERVDVHLTVSFIILIVTFSVMEDRMTSTGFWPTLVIDMHYLQEKNRLDAISWLESRFGPPNRPVWIMICKRPGRRAAKDAAADQALGYMRSIDRL
ncbi:hypothetical protein EDD18DRAFT_1107668 [Armillaria luteobubalina]|uniref:Uncharacterized protein n=1 Tax=Armillaria luteobubalina TaxID=153913 RepID=A0AA39Q2R0_9AGAR|nr:hypothetical protein EDD18DRAFT_1107668 [Armillaria luteobubalina]